MLRDTFIALMTAALVGACSQEETPGDTATKEGPMEKAGKKMDQMAEKAAGAMSTAYLHTKVRGTLLDGIGTDALRIDIDVDDGKVVLKGTVRMRQTKELAKELVENLDGVKSVESKLEHEPAGTDDPGPMEEAGAELADAMLATKVRLALLDKLGEDALAIDVEVAEGTVVLSGKTTKADAAVEAVRGLGDVKNVENQME